MGSTHGGGDTGFTVGATLDLPLSTLRFGAVGRAGSFGWGHRCSGGYGTTCRDAPHYGFVGSRIAGQDGSSPYAFLEGGYAVFFGGSDEVEGFSIAGGIGSRPDRVALELSLGVTLGAYERMLLAALRLGVR